MAVDLLGFSKMDEQIAIQEAASDGLRSMEHLIRVLSQQQQQQQQQQKLNLQPPSSHNSVHNLDCREITDFTVSKFKKVNSILNRTGHARFRRGPSTSSSSSSSSFQQQQQQQQHIEKLSDHQNRNNSTHHSTLNHHQQQPQPVSISPSPHSQSLTLDFTKPNFMTPNPSTHSEVSTSQFTKDSSFSISPPMSSNTSSFLSSITADGSVSNGKQGSSIFVAPAPTISAGKPPLSSSYRKKCHEHGHSDNVSVNYSVSGSRCHCSSKRRKSRVKKTVRVPAISTKMADIPADEHSWRKYGQKPIKGSPYPRGYYKCSTIRGCPARKHVERDQDEPTMLIVTYEGEHRHSQPPSPPVVGESTVHGGGSVGLVMFESS